MDWDDAIEFIEEDNLLDEEIIKNYVFLLKKGKALDKMWEELKKEKGNYGFSFWKTTWEMDKFKQLMEEYEEEYLKEVE
jgi:hypothetical protein